jgi:methylated-DNA-protein-cysteine methyltransferase-like protein
MPDKKKYSFFEDAQSVARLVPYGRVTSYGAIAKYLSAPRSARMVGYAMKGAAHDSSVPAHRVVNRIGLLSGKANFESPCKMQELLEAEGIAVKEDQIVNFDNVFWDPAVELNL